MEVLGKLRSDSGKKVRVRPDLDSGNNFNLGGGGVFWNQIPEQGCSGEFWSKFSGSLAGWCITDGLSHVETKKY